jgi:excisionase family DNA binding protein
VARSAGVVMGEPDRPRRVIGERVVLSTAMDPCLTLTALAEYSGLSKTALLRAINQVPDRALPCYRIGNKILVRRSEFDRWLEAYRHRGRPSLEKALTELGLLKTRA